MRYAYEHCIPVTPRGAGTGLSGGAVPIYGGILLCTEMNKILEWDLDTMTVVIEPGVLVMELANAAQKKVVFYPPEPGEKRLPLVENVKQTNAGGMKAVGYGVTRNYVVSMECVMPNGDVMQFGSNVAKKYIRI